MEQDQILFGEYKKLRNKIRATEIREALLVVWNYIAHLNGRNVAFEGIEVNQEFIAQTGIQKRIIIAEWEMQVLLREILLNAQLAAHKPKTFRNGIYFSDTLNLVKNIQNKISELYMSPDETILMEMHRIAHQQFPWQTNTPSEIYITRYSKIFSHEKIRNIVERKIGLSIEKFYLVGFVLYGYFLDKLIIDNPPKIEGLISVDVSLEDIDKVLDKIALNIEELREKIKEAQKINQDFIYTFDPVQAYPLIKMEWTNLDRIVCPDVTRLFWRITDGLYYELVGVKGFDNAFGDTFQDYVGDVLQKTCKNKLSYLAEESYGPKKEKKDTVDWLVEDDKTVMFVECKTKRMRNESKTNLLDTTSLEEDLGEMAKYVVQVYKTIRDYKDNKYPSSLYKEKKIYPMVVTLENWHIFGLTYQKLKNKVSKRLEEEGLPKILLEDMPFSVVSVDTFEIMIQAMEQVGIGDVLLANTSGEEEQHDPFMVLWNKFNSEVKNSKPLFPDEFERIIPKKYHPEN